MLDIAKGTTEWNVKRYDKSFFTYLLECVEDEVNRYVKANTVGYFSDLLEFKSTHWDWARNQYAHTDINALYAATPRLKFLPEEIQIILLGRAKMRADKAFDQQKPYDTEIQKGNVWLNEGINNVFDIICGNGSTTLYNNANARLGVGNDGTAPAATQTGLLGTSTLFKAMDTGFPTSGTSQQAVFQATFADADAVFAWLEESIDNGATANKNLQRSNTNLGTKPNNETWVLKGTVSLS